MGNIFPFYCFVCYWIKLSCSTDSVYFVNCLIMSFAFTHHLFSIISLFVRILYILGIVAVCHNHCKYFLIFCCLLTYKSFNFHIAKSINLPFMIYFILLNKWININSDVRITAQHCCSQQIIQATENLFQKCVFTFDLILLFYYSLKEMNFPNYFSRKTFGSTLVQVVPIPCQNIFYFHAV